MIPILSATWRHFWVDISKSNNFWLSALRAITHRPSGDQRGQQIPSEPATWVTARVLKSSNMICVGVGSPGTGGTPYINALPSLDQVGSRSLFPDEICSGLPPSAGIT